MDKLRTEQKSASHLRTDHRKSNFNGTRLKVLEMEHTDRWKGSPISVFIFVHLIHTNHKIV